MMQQPQQPPFHGGPPPFRPAAGPLGGMTAMQGMPPPRTMSGMLPGSSRPAMPAMPTRPSGMPPGQGPPRMPPSGIPGPPPRMSSGAPYTNPDAGVQQMQQHMAGMSLGFGTRDQVGIKSTPAPPTVVQAAAHPPTLTNGIPSSSSPAHPPLQQQQSPPSTSMPKIDSGAPPPPTSAATSMPSISRSGQFPPPVPPMAAGTMPTRPSAPMPPMPGQGMPMASQGMPMASQGMPMASQGMPMASQGMPMSGQGMPMPTQGMPMSGQGMPMPGQGMPMPSQGMPMPGQGMPMSGQGMPMPGQGMPMPGQGMPMPGQGMPMPGQGMQMSGGPLPQPPVSSTSPHMPPPLMSGPRGAAPPMPGQPGMAMAPSNLSNSASGMPPPAPRPGQPPLPNISSPPGGMNSPPGPGYVGGNMGHRYPGAQYGAPQQQQPGGYGQQQSGGYVQHQSGGYSQQQQQSARRLNPDDMPSPLQVIEEDRRSRSGEFVTAPRGALPPLVTTQFVVRDGGNASPRFIRSTMYSIPATPEMMKQTCVPFGVVLSPLARQAAGEQPLYPGTSLASGPVRCNRCKAYMSPLMQFMDGGRRFQCLLCHQSNETPAEYYCNMDSQGARADKYQRPELCLGSYEFIATPEYCRDKQLPKEPAFIFVLEMSQMMVQRGVISLLCQNITQLLEHLPKDSLGGQTEPESKIKIGFVTYDSNVHFYKLNGQAPEMCVVCDKDEMFVPVPEGVLCDVSEAADNIAKLRDNIPQIFQGTKENSGVLGCAIQAGMSALKASGRTGKLFVFHSSLPQTEGPGKLRNREDRKLLGTEKEKSILSPQTNYYNNLGQELVGVGCGVDLYIFNDSYVDLSTIGQVSRLTGGQVYKYSYFQRDHDGPRLLQDLQRNISREIVFDAVMRVRTSTGVRAVDFYGHFFMANTQDLELACMDDNKAVALEIKHDDKLTEDAGVYIQAALLYTSCGGQRRLRVINLSLNTCTQMAELYKNCELDTIMNFFGKMAMTKFMDSSAKQVKEQMVSRTATILACYRKNCASPSAAGQLILPELLKLLPLYVNCLAKCDALSGGQDLTCDDRALHMYHLSSCGIRASLHYYYPRLLPLTEELQESGFPTPVRTSYEKLRSDGAFLLENSLVMFLWVGSNVPSSWLQDVFGVNAPHQLDPTLSDLPSNDNETSRRVRDIIAQVRAEAPYHLRLFVVPQQGKHEVVLRSYLVEDKGVYGSPSYVDFLCHIHKEIRALMQ